MQQLTIIINEYKKLPHLSWTKDPLEAWRLKQKDGVLLPMIPVVKKYACIPATSVPSEQLFSAAGDLVREKRSRLSHKHVDVLLFLNKNSLSNSLSINLVSGKKRDTNKIIKQNICQDYNT